ncbi:MAG: adventurous gliding motility lipoprotein CglB [Myxococcaceae bacterium]
MPSRSTSSRPVVLASLNAAVAALLVLNGCQVYDFEPVTPLALGQTSQVTTLTVTPFKPNLMLLVDKSGSMDLPIDTTDLACFTAPGGEVCGQDKAYPCDVMSCPTRWSTLSTTLTEFLQVDDTAARYGLTFFPQPPDANVANQCIPTLAIQAPIPITADDTPESLANLADAGIAALATVQSANQQGPTGTGGGTPTGDSFKYFNSNPGAVVDPVRDAYILLLTDGLPNCNSSLNPATCVCTLESDQDCQDTQPAGIGCLDDVATVNVIGELKSVQKITTVVLGFGADTAAPAAAATLQAMAIAGGFAPRLCPNKTQDCGPTNPCDLSTGLCSKQYYEATDATSLADALNQIYTGVGAKACVVPLEVTPTNEDLISVLVNGNPVLSGPDTWSYQPADGGTPTLVFVGSLCTEIQASSKADPLQLQIRIVTPL